MKKLIAIVFLAFLPALSAVAAVTITVSGGGQTTAEGTFFVNPITVLVTEGGVGVPHAQVEFLDPTGTILFANRDLASGDVSVFTNQLGMAVAPAAMGAQAGTAIVTIRTLGNSASSETISLTVVPGGPTRFVVVSGSHQNATVGTAYAQPWVAQALDANGNVVPNAAVLFYAPADATVASVTFDGTTSTWVRANASGVATSPVPTANMVAGHEEALVMTQKTGAVQFAIFDYNNMPAGGSSGGSGGSGGGSDDGCGRQGKGNGNCGSSPDHSGGQGNNGNGKG